MGKEKSETEKTYEKIEKYVITHLPAVGYRWCVERLRDKMDKLLRGEERT